MTDPRVGGSDRTSDLWGCPDCGRRFVNANQWHSCGNPDNAEQLLADHSEKSVAIYRAVEAALARTGEFRIHPQKTRVAFITRMTFASVRLARKWVDLAFISDEPVDHPRIRKIELFGPTSFGHHLRLTQPADVDDDVRAWLARARRRGDQETLDPGARLDPLPPGVIEILRVPLSARVRTEDGQLILTTPSYAADAFYGDVTVRIRGRQLSGFVAEGPADTECDPRPAPSRNSASLSATPSTSF